tara:strand:+ start:468 stop:803 length:336 start_codon:yes stop_codon:yes gene_type:complete
MSDVRTVVKEYLQDTMYECDVIMRSDRSKRLTVITDNLRGVCGITVVTVKEAAKKVSKTVEVTKLKVKFFLTEPELKRHMSRMQMEARKIDGIYSFIATSVNKVRNRIYRK